MLLFIVLVLCMGSFDCIPCEPAKGSTAIIIGQDYGSILNYTSTVKLNSAPFGVMSYISLRLSDDILVGVSESTDYGSGIQWVKGLTDKYPGSSIQLGLWVVRDCLNITLGLLDRNIDTLIDFMHQSEADYYLRIGYEFDSAENCYPTELYKAAFGYIVTRFRSANVTNVQYVWHASGFRPRNGLVVSDWFPGTEFVDWCGVSMFQQPYDCTESSQCKMEYADALAEFCSQHGLPLMIAESTPFGGILDESAAVADPLATNRAGYSGSTWHRWFVPVLAFIERHDVRIWSYINCNWDALPMWAVAHAPGVYWGDSRIEAHTDLLQRWNTEVLANSRFITSHEQTVISKKCQPDCQETTAAMHPVHYFRFGGYLAMFAIAVGLLCFVLLDAVPKMVLNTCGRSGYARIV